MKAAVVTAPDQVPQYSEFRNPEAQAGQQVVTVKAAALTNLTKGRAAGSHYSSSSMYPFIAGVDGVGLTVEGQRVFFFATEAPFGAMAEKVLVRAKNCVPLPGDLDDVTAAALANPGMSAMAALKARAKFQPGETVLVNGATGSAGKLAVQIAKHLGAKKVIATGRDTAVLEDLKTLGADVVLDLKLGQKELSAAFQKQFAGEGIDVVLDYLFGKSAELLLASAATSMEIYKPLRYVQIGNVSGAEISLSAPLLRKIPIVLMGSGLGSVPWHDLIAGIAEVMQAAVPARLFIPTRAVPLANVAETWNADTGKDRVVFVV